MVKLWPNQLFFLLNTITMGTFQLKLTIFYRHGVSGTPLEVFHLPPHDLNNILHFQISAILILPVLFPPAHLYLVRFHGLSPLQHVEPYDLSYLDSVRPAFTSILLRFNLGPSGVIFSSSARVTFLQEGVIVGF